MGVEERANQSASKV